MLLDCAVCTHGNLNEVRDYLTDKFQNIANGKDGNKQQKELSHELCGAYVLVTGIRLRMLEKNTIHRHTDTQ